MSKPKPKAPPRKNRAGTSIGPSKRLHNARGGVEPADVLDLARYAIGTRLRHARLMQGARLKDVADAAGCSESLVSKIENNKLEPSLQVLLKICNVLKIGLGQLFTQQEDDTPVVTRAGERAIARQRSECAGLNGTRARLGEYRSSLERARSDGRGVPAGKQREGQDSSRVCL